MNLFDEKTFLETLSNATEEECADQLDNLVQLMGERNFCRKAAAQLVLFAKPEIAIPNSLDHFSGLVRDGIEHFLSGISYRRLRRVLLNQFLLRDSPDTMERLLNLALHFPTLHKLGQIIARNPHLDPEVKRWLVALEQGNYGTDPDVQVRYIKDQLAKFESPPDVIISPDIIAEASVATVLLFYYQNSSSRQKEGVFKVLKPGIEDDLLEELDALKETFAFLEQNRSAYGLQEIKLTAIFSEISGDMAREIDLSAEQKHMAEAVRIYKDVAGVRIPCPVPFSSSTMTAMEYIDGMTISDVQLTRQQGIALARLIFEAVLCVPLFSREEHALFHGDPHAGNMLVIEGDEPNKFDLALLDWTLAAHLTKTQRVRVMGLMVGIMKNDSRTLYGVIESLVVETEKDSMNPDFFIKRINRLLASEEYHDCDLLKRSFLLLETMTLEGVVFPSELILFRKSFFTLEGVINDISSDFEMGRAMERYLGKLLLKEMPLRFGNWIDPAADKSENYQTLISNKKLQELSLHQTLAFWQHTMRQCSSLIEAQIRVSTDFFLYLHRKY
ncbi:MAG: AarF/UbiB family protein [Desulforhopalus sp.]